MKTKYKLTAVLFLGLLLLSSCKDFLNRGPITNPSSEGFFSSRVPIEEYVNGLYVSLPSYGTYGIGMLAIDKNSDNIISEDYDRRLNGEFNVNSAESDWANIYYKLRDVNYFLTYYSVPKELETSEILSLKGEVYFLRAYWHFELLKKFGSAPIMDRNWDNEATILGLQKEQAKRNELAKFVIQDLKTAIGLLHPRTVYKGLRINKEAAQVLLMNVALYEGSWEYYHRNDDFKAPVDEHEYFLNEVLTVGDELMSRGISLHSKSNDITAESFAELFNSDDLSNIDEVLLWKKYSLKDGIHNSVSQYLKGGVVDPSSPAGVTKSLVDCYLNANGTLADINSSDYKDFIKTFEGRDPRLLRTIMNNGCNWASTKGGNTRPMRLQEYSEDAKDLISPPRINGDGNGRSITGYHIRLGINDNFVEGFGQTAMPIIRYAEALLAYAEAAEILQRANDEVLDKTIRLLRKRAGVIYQKPSGIDTNFPKYGYEITPVMREIRRERRVELALQGFRLDDLLRWKGENVIMNKRGIGAYLGDDAILFRSFSEKERIEIREKVILDDHKYMDPLAKKLPNGYQFNPKRDYLLPIPSTELSTEKKLTQNPGWN